MYPGPTGSPENHRKGVCSDGVSPNLKAVEWPQPPGIFTNGTNFHPIPFLKALRDIYELFIVQKGSSADSMEHEAFAQLISCRTLICPDGAILFRLFDLQLDPSTPEELIVTHNDAKHLRLDCLRG